MKFVIWGAGERGKRIYKQLSDKYVVAFIDRNIEKKIGGIPTISLDEYLQKWRQYPIIISFENEQIGVETLEQIGIDYYFRLTDACGPYQEPYQRGYFKKYVKNYFDDANSYLLRGKSLHMVMVAQWARENGIDLSIDESCIKSAFIKKKLKEEGYRLVNGIVEKYDRVLCCDYDKNRRIYENEEDFFDIDGKIEDYCSPEVEVFKDKHKGKKCFIIATGPSLQLKDLDVLKENNFDTFSMNGIYKVFDRTEWRPKYFVAEDYTFLASYVESDQINIENEITFLLGDTNEELCRKKRKENEYIYHVNYIRRDKEKTKFATDLLYGTYAGGTVTFACMQWAIYMGYTEIYLLGVDFSYFGTAEKKCYGHFYDEKEYTARPATEWVYNSYISAKEYAESHDVKIYNATRGGKLEVFERVDFDSLFK